MSEKNSGTKPRRIAAGKQADKGKQNDTGKYEYRGKQNDTGKYEYRGKQNDTEKYEYRGKQNDTEKYGYRGKQNDTEKYGYRGKQNDTEKRAYKEQSDTGKHVYTKKQSDTARYGYKGKKNDIEKYGYKDKHGYKEKKPVKEKPKKNDGHRELACPYMRQCGGCNIMDQSYQIHLSEKQKAVDTLLKKYCKVEPIIRMAHPVHYRHKVHAVFDHDRKGNPISGVYEEGTHRVVAVDQCLIHDEKADAIIATIRGMLKSFKILTYDEDTGYGLLRHVLIRTGLHSGEIMVVLVLGSPILPSKNNFVKALLQEHPEITTIVVNINDKRTSMVLGEKDQVIYGRGCIEDTLCGKTFRISPKSFYQVNPLQTEVLYNKAIELAQLNGVETVVDAYCGIGTIGIIASDRAKKVIGVELNKDAVRDAAANARRNEASNIEFYNNDAGIFLSQMAMTGESADVVFLDPPRNGGNPQFLDALAAIKPKKVVYISCNPVTLERDIDYMAKKGYKAEVAVPVDLFPWTSHTEVVVLLQH